MFFELLVLISCLAAGPARAQAADEPVRFEASHDAMGTTFTITTYGRQADELAAVVNEVFEEIDRLDAQMSNYKPASELSNINRQASRRETVIEPKLFALIEDALRYSAETNGAFDITVGPLVKAWGFFRGQGRVPPPSEISQILKRTGYRRVALDARQRAIRFEAEGMELDLGGIAKGYAVDCAVEILRANGVARALVSSGTSSIYALGVPPGERVWKINLRDPYDRSKVADVVELRNASVATSGSYEKFFRAGGKTYSHILDPRTGAPVHGVLAVSVLSASATESDALSTAFFVLGVDASRKYLARHTDLGAVFYQPGKHRPDFKRTVLRSNPTKLPPEVLAEIRER